MLILTKPVEPFDQPPYRGKIVKGGGVRRHDDWSRVILNETDSNGCRLVVHDNALCGSTVFEIHNALSDNSEELENCTMESFHLNSKQRFNLAVYLLSTVQGDYCS